MKNGIWKKIFLYTFVGIFTFISIKDTHIYEMESYLFGLNMFYQVCWSYINIAFIYVPLFLFFLMNRIKFLLHTVVISRYNRKRDILIAEIYETVIQAIEMALVTNATILIFIVTTFEGGLDAANIFYVLCCNILAQCFGWILIGNIYILFVNLTDKTIFSMIITILIVGFILFAHSATFVFKKWFIDLYYQMVIDIYEKQPYQIVVQILKSIAQGVLVFILSCGLYFKKPIWGDETKSEVN